MSQGCGGESVELILVKEFELCCAVRQASSHGGDGEALGDKGEGRKGTYVIQARVGGHSNAGSPRGVTSNRPKE